MEGRVQERREAEALQWRETEEERVARELDDRERYAPPCWYDRVPPPPEQLERED